MDCVVATVGDSHTYSTTHLVYRALGMTNDEVDNGSIGTPPNEPRLHWRKFHQSGGQTTICCNYAKSGTNLDDAMDLVGADNIAWRAALNELAVNRGANRRHILYVAFGTNKGPSTAAAFITAMESYIATQKAAGWDDIILATIGSRTDAPWGAAGESNTDYAHPINLVYRDPAWQALHGVTISDNAAVPEYGPWDLIGNVLAIPSENATHFYDHVHPTRATVELVRPTIRAAINARITAAGGVVLPDIVA